MNPCIQYGINYGSFIILSSGLAKKVFVMKMELKLYDNLNVLYDKIKTSMFQVINATA